MLNPVFFQLAERSGLEELRGFVGSPWHCRQGCRASGACARGQSVSSYLLNMGLETKVQTQNTDQSVWLLHKLLFSWAFISPNFCSVLFQDINLAGLSTGKHPHNLTSLFFFLIVIYLFLGLKCFRLCNGTCIAQETNYSLECFTLRQSPLIFNCWFHLGFFQLTQF